MSEGNDIEFRLSTTADTTGAEEVVESLNKAGNAAKETTDAAKEKADKALAETRSKIDELATRSETLKKETKEFGDTQEAANAKMRLGTAAMSGVAAGGAIVAKIFGQIGEAIKSIDVENLRTVNSEMAAQVEEARGWAEVLTDPINGITRLLTGTTLEEGFSSLNKSIAAVAGFEARIRGERIAASLRDQEKIKTQYDEETAALVKQKAEIERILDLRRKLAQLQTEGLNQEVDAAEIRGGDVDLAKSNALAAKLQQGLQELGGNLETAENDRAQAQTAFDSAVEQYNQGVQDGLAKLDPAALSKLAENVDAAQTQLRSADQAVQDQRQIFTESKRNLLMGVENELATMESDTSKGVSKATEDVRDNIYNALKNEVAQLGNDTAKVVGESFTKVRENQQKINDGIVNHNTEMMGLMKQLAGGFVSMRAEINTLKQQIRHIGGTGY